MTYAMGAEGFVARTGSDGCPSELEAVDRKKLVTFRGILEVVVHPVEVMNNGVDVGLAASAAHWAAMEFAPRVSSTSPYKLNIVVMPSTASAT